MPILELFSPRMGDVPKKSGLNWGFAHAHVSTADAYIALRREFISDGIADENTTFILNHFSHNGKDVVYDDFSKIAEKENFLTSYDGMEFEF